MPYHEGSTSGGRTRDRLTNEAVRRFETMAQRRRQEEAPQPPRVITISRQLGAGGRRVAEILSKELKWPLYDKEILEHLAEHGGSQYQAKMFEHLDERVQHEIESFVSTLLNRADQFTYMYLLPKAILTIAQTDCIILGRAAHLLLKDAFNIRIEASLDTRVRNMVYFEKLDEDEARRRIHESDKVRAEFTRQVISTVPEKERWTKHQRMYDLTINTDCFNVKEAGRIALTAARIFLEPQKQRVCFPEEKQTDWPAQK